MISFAPATEEDDPVVRALLRDHAMPSWVNLSLEREPSFAASLNHFGCEQAVIARDGSDTVGMYLWAEQPLHVNGQAACAGYLAALRVNPAYRHRLRILREGYASIPVMSGPRGPRIWYTSVASENRSARRLLEANLSGMPRYQPLGEMVTMALPQAQGRRRGLWATLGAERVRDYCATYNRHAQRFQFAPALSPDIVHRCGANSFVHERNGRIAGCMALWNQQAYKQVVARGYRQPVAALRPVYNLNARLRRTVALPRVGQGLDQTFLAFLAADDEAPDLFVDLVRDALSLCSTQVLTLGLHADHVCLPALLRAFRPATYRTCIYAVDFGASAQLDDRPVQPEVAVL